MLITRPDALRFLKTSIARFHLQFTPSPRAEVDTTSVDGQGLSNADSQLASVSPAED
jgi:hypothetical protein